MLTPGRFEKLTAAYGGDLRRWPEPFRAQAETLLRTSAEAHALLAQAQALDAAIHEAGEAERAILWSRAKAQAIAGNGAKAQAIAGSAAKEQAALARIRSGVGERIAAQNANHRPGARIPGSPGGMLFPRLGWIGLATAGTLAVVTGLLLGFIYTPASTGDTLLAILQPTPIHLLADPYDYDHRETP